MFGHSELSQSHHDSYVPIYTENLPDREPFQKQNTLLTVIKML